MTNFDLFFTDKTQGKNFKIFFTGENATKSYTTNENKKIEFLFG
tara:strand:+ start:223 stop:354 length:132 start_codon:yes stop_codon:yes gene_type:complete